jgi:hypothetical protein
MLQVKKVDEQPWKFRRLTLFFVLVYVSKYQGKGLWPEINQSGTSSWGMLEYRKYVRQPLKGGPTDIRGTRILGPPRHETDCNL